MLNPDGKIDENRDNNSDARNRNMKSDLNRPLSSSITGFIIDDKNVDGKERRHQETKIARGEKAINQMVDKVFSNCTNTYDFYLDKTGLLLMIDIPFYRSKLSGLKNKNVKIRLITEINLDNIRHCKQVIMEFDAQVRHLENTKGNFGISDNREYIQTTIVYENKPLVELMYSNVKGIVQQDQFLFEILWEKAIHAEQRMRELETGSAFETTKIIESAIKTKQYFIEIIQNAKQEILILFPSLNAVKREVKMGLIDLLKQRSSENVRVRILSPANKHVKEILFSQDAAAAGGGGSGKYEGIENIICKEIRKQEYLMSTILIVDRKYVLATELKDDSKEVFEKAIGTCTYSTSIPTILSYISIFESLWDQTEMSGSLKIANEKLVQSEELEREFINTAAHELRTPTQAIMGFTELNEEVFEDLLKNLKTMPHDELARTIGYLHKNFESISRNSTRLNDLINNLLDVARIESNTSNSLGLHKEKLDLIKEINACLKTQLDQKLKTMNIKFNFINQILEEQCWIYADKSRLIQILVNLIDNAIKFSPVNGIIDILIKDNDYEYLEEDAIEFDKSKSNSSKSEVLVEVSLIWVRGYLPKLYQPYLKNLLQVLMQEQDLDCILHAI